MELEENGRLIRNCFRFFITQNFLFILDFYPHTKNERQIMKEEDNKSMQILWIQLFINSPLSTAT